ncbi:MAG: CesD/SycD/LcrH family type secretion system chaperone [Planctomycetota bacterium]|nr:CesD/SycD/LcrH family type secretion system chaperone [Planctomycetota bacterium]
MSRRFRSKSVDRWLKGTLSNAQFLGLHDEDRHEILFHAHRFFDEGRIPDAERLFNLALLLWPDSAGATRGLGACRQFSGDLESAVDYYEKTLHVRGQDPHAVTNRAECLLLLGRLDEARAALALVSTSEPALRDRIELLRGSMPAES